MYEQIEELRSRGGEKVALFFTAANMGGALISVLPVYLVTTTTPILLRFLLIAIAGLIGYGVTLEVRGLAFYERAMWTIRNFLRRRMNGSRVTPAMLRGTMACAATERPIAIGGPITIVRARAMRGDKR